MVVRDLDTPLTEVDVFPPARDLDELLDDIYLGQDRITQSEIHRRAVAAELPAELLIRITAMPQGEYAIDEAAEILAERTVGDEHREPTI
ncbi:hypothetical protein ACWDV4_00600 [Micromonospora sp. NPDC003197]